MGLLSGMQNLDLTGHKRRGSDVSATSTGGQNGQAPSGNPNDTEVLDKDEGNLLLSLISQIRPGADLSRIQFPTFVLEPRSLLERITDFFSHPELIFGAGANPDAKERFLHVLTYYLSGWHIKPKGVKKPYNPILGEFFRCTYTYEDGSEGFYVAEQVSHHPPVSAFFYVSPKNGILITGEIKPKSKFLGNSAATIMEGENRIRLLQRPQDGDYSIKMPNMFARGILFGKMVLELGDVSTITCAGTDYQCEVEFKTKGWISGGYNAIAGHIVGPGRSDVGEITGHWSSSMEYREAKSGKKQTLFDVNTVKAVEKTVIPEDKQEENESRRLWTALTRAIKGKDMEAAATAKNAVEDAQRERAKTREASGEKHELRFFVAVGEKFMPKIGVDKLPQDPEQMAQAVKDWIFGDKADICTQRSASSMGSATPAPRKESTATQETVQSSRMSVSSTASKEQTPSIASFESAASHISIPVQTTAPGPPAPGPHFSSPPTKQ